MSILQSTIKDGLLQEQSDEVVSSSSREVLNEIMTAVRKDGLNLELKNCLATQGKGYHVICLTVQLH